MTNTKYTLADFDLKRCSKCKTQKPFGEFGKNKSMKDGINTWCKSCKSIAKKNYYKNNTLKVLKSCAKYRLDNPDQRRKTKRAWKRKNLEWIKYPVQSKARASTKRLVLRGILKKSPCQICGEIKSEAHHLDYKNAINVQWLCSAHHKAWHRLFYAEGL